MKNNNNMIYVGIAVVVIIIAAAILLSRQSSYTPVTTATTTATQSIPTTVTTQNPTTITIQNIVTTTVSNLTIATGPNLATCSGYNDTISSPNFESIGYCNWRGGLLNVTVFGGTYQGTTLALVEQNVTTAPFNDSTTASACTMNSTVLGYVPPGNYRISLLTGLPSGSCGSATVRLSH